MKPTSRRRALAAFAGVAAANPHLSLGAAENNSVLAMQDRSLVTSGLVNAFEFMSAASIAAVKAFSYDVDVTVELQAAMNTAFANGMTLALSAGGYRVTSLTLPGDSSSRFKPFIMRGAGTGEVFALGGAGGTVLKSSANAPVLQYIQDRPLTGNGQADISFINFWGNSATPVLRFGAFFAQSELHHCGIYQSGTGNGIEIEFANTIDIHHNYILNRDCVTTGLGGNRVGIGMHIKYSHDAALTTIHKNTSRGFKTGFKFGADVGKVLYFAQVDQNECSTNQNGMEITAACQSVNISNNYFEGGEGGIGILDNGRSSTVSGNFMFAGYSILLASGKDSYGGSYRENTLSVASRAQSIAIQLDCSGAYAGLKRTVSHNTIIFGGSGGVIAGVVGIKIMGVRPHLDLTGNVFNPQGAWTGGSGTAKILNLSTGHDGSTGSGIIGMSVTGDEAIEFPLVSRGAFSLGLSLRVLSDLDIIANVLTISEASSFVLTANSTQIVRSITSQNIGGKWFCIRATNAKTTFENTALLRLAGSSNFTPGAQGAVIWFQHQAGVTWETSRTLY